MRRPHTSFGLSGTEYRDAATRPCRVHHARPVCRDQALAHQISAGGGRILAEVPKIMKWTGLDRHPPKWLPSVEGMSDLLAVAFRPADHAGRSHLARVMDLQPRGPLSISMHFAVPLAEEIRRHTPQ